MGEKEYNLTNSACEICGLEITGLSAEDYTERFPNLEQGKTPRYEGRTLVPLTENHWNCPQCGSHHLIKPPSGSAEYN